MAFHYFTIDSIKQIDASDIPEAFFQYYQNLSDEMKEEVRDIRPDLVEALGLEEDAEESIRPRAGRYNGPGVRQCDGIRDRR